MQQPDSFFTIEQVQADKDHDYVLAHHNQGVPMYRKVVTDPEGLQQAAREEWLEVLSQLWLAYDKQLDIERMTIYQRSLSILPMGLLDLAIQRVMREHTYNTVPTLGDVWAAVRAELHNPRDLEQAIERWCDERWSATVYRFGVAVETEPVDASHA